MRPVGAPLLALSLLLAGACASPPNGAAAPRVHRGRVLEVLPAGVWTYLRLATQGGPVWVAVPAAEVRPGDRVETPRGLYMKDFRSRTLGRTFREVYLAPRCKVLARPLRPSARRGEASPPPLPPPPGGLTLGELWARRRELAGREVTVQGRVTKVVPQVLGRNWVHLEDGSGRTLTVATKAQVAPGSTVRFRGRVALDRDLGFGYRYDLLLENGRLLPRDRQ